MWIAKTHVFFAFKNIISDTKDKKKKIWVNLSSARKRNKKKRHRFDQIFFNHRLNQSTEIRASRWRLGNFNAKRKTRNVDEIQRRCSICIYNKRRLFFLYTTISVVTLTRINRRDFSLR